MAVTIRPVVSKADLKNFIHLPLLNEESRFACFDHCVLCIMFIVMSHTVFIESMFNNSIRKNNSFLKGTFPTFLYFQK